MFIEQLDKLIALRKEQLGVVVHVGAGICKEFEYYERCNPTKLLLVDADKEACAELKEKTAHMKNCEVLNNGVSAANQQLTLYSYNNSRLNSSLAPQLLADYFPGIETFNQQTISSITLGNLLDNIKLSSSADSGKLNVLILDVLGCEIDLIKSAETEIFSCFEYVVIYSLEPENLAETCRSNALQRFKIVQLNSYPPFSEIVLFNNSAEYMLDQAERDYSDKLSKLEENNDKAALQQKASLENELLEVKRRLESEEEKNKELIYRQELLGLELLRYESQLELVKDLVLREKSF